MRHLPPSRHCRTSAMVWEDRCDLHVGSCSIKPKQKVSGFSTGQCFSNFFRLSHSCIIDMRNSATQLPGGLLARRVRSRGPHRLYAPSVSRLSDSNWHRPHALSVPPYSDSNCGVRRNGQGFACFHHHDGLPIRDIVCCVQRASAERKGDRPIRLGQYI